MQTAAFEVMKADTHRVALVTALPEPDDVDFSPGALLASAAVVTGMLVLIAFPGELFNTALETHYDEIRRWFGLGPKRVESHSGASQVLPFVGLLVVGGLLYSLLNPAFRFDRSTLGAALGLSLAMGIVTLAFDIPSLAYGLAFRRQMADPVKGRLAAASTILVLALSIGSWMAMAPVSETADKPGASLGLLILEATLGGIFWCGLDLSRTPRRRPAAAAMPAGQPGAGVEPGGLDRAVHADTAGIRPHPPASEHGVRGGHEAVADSDRHRSLRRPRPLLARLLGRTSGSALPERRGDRARMGRGRLTPQQVGVSFGT